MSYLQRQLLDQIGSGMINNVFGNISILIGPDKVVVPLFTIQSIPLSCVLTTTEVFWSWFPR
jgi:hypothetical protein